MKKIKFTLNGSDTYDEKPLGFFIYQKYFDKFPSVISINNRLTYTNTINILQKSDFVELYKSELYWKKTKYILSNVNNFYINKKTKQVIFIVHKLRTGLCELFLFYNKKNYPLNLMTELQKSFVEEETKNLLNIITESQEEGLTLINKPIPLLDYNKDHYNDNFHVINETIINKLNENKNGIILLHGIPGTGKTSYIQSLIGNVEHRMFIYFPIALMSQIDSPSMQTFLLNYDNAILILEDAEQLIQKRDEFSGSQLSGLLNISDGLLGKTLNLTIIITFNTKLNNVDEALLRKGRLIYNYEFEKLSIEKVNNLCTILGKESANKEMTLTEIYNSEDVNTIKEKNRIGF